MTTIILAAAVALVSPERMAGVLRQKEQGPPNNPWQFTSATWSQYTKTPRSVASPAKHRRVAIAHIEWCIKALPLLGLPVTPGNVALLWHAGYGTIEQGQVTPEQRLFAEHVANLYHE